MLHARDCRRLTSPYRLAPPKAGPHTTPPPVKVRFSESADLLRPEQPGQLRRRTGRRRRSAAASVCSASLSVIASMTFFVQASHLLPAVNLHHSIHVIHGHFVFHCKHKKHVWQL